MRGKPLPITDREIELVRAEMGRPRAEVAARLGITVNRVKVIRERINAAAPAADNRPPWSADEIEYVREMLDDGISYAEIGRRFGLSRKAVAGRIDRLNARLPADEALYRAEDDEQDDWTMRYDEKAEAAAFAGIDFRMAGVPARRAA